MSELIFLPKHLTIYLDHALQVRPKFRSNEIWTMNGIVGDSVKCKQYGQLRNYKSFIPLLRPLNLDKEITHDGNTFIPRVELEKLYGAKLWDKLPKNLVVRDLPYWVVFYLCRWHFDVWGLLNAKLAEKI